MGWEELNAQTPNCRQALLATAGLLSPPLLPFRRSFPSSPADAPVFPHRSLPQPLWSPLTNHGQYAYVLMPVDAKNDCFTLPFFLQNFYLQNVDISKKIRPAIERSRCELRKLNGLWLDPEHT